MALTSAWLPSPHHGLCVGGEFGIIRVDIRAKYLGLRLAPVHLPLYLLPPRLRALDYSMVTRGTMALFESLSASPGALTLCPDLRTL